MKFSPYIFVGYGMFIVFTGMVILAIAVSNIKRIFFLMDKNKMKRAFAEKKAKQLIFISKNKLSEIQDAVKIFGDENVKASFSLPFLINLLMRSGKSNAHELVDLMIKKEIISPDEKGYFLWNLKSAILKKIIKK